MIEISKEVKEIFKTHALKDAPREACGLVAIIKGKQHYYECKNLSASDGDFILCPEDYRKVEDFVSSNSGDIFAVLHSHPTTKAKPSMADLAGCELSGLEWSIYSPVIDEWFSFVPTGYKAPLIGRVFKHGVFDCYSALRDWYQLNFGIVLKDFDRKQYWWENGDNLFMDNFREAGFEEVKDMSLEVGDVLLINFSSFVVNHCAVYIGNDKVFHQTMNRLSSREIYGGWLKKNTRTKLRYRLCEK